MVSDRKWDANALRTNSAHDGDSEPIEIRFIQHANVTKAVPKGYKHVVGNEHRLHEFDDKNAIDEAFCESSVIRRCQIV